MNFNKFINSDYLKSNPLCGISTYKDTLNLATGACTRRIKKLVLTGDEVWSEIAAGLYRIMVNGYLGIIDIQVGMSSHFGGGYTVGAAPSAKRNELSFLVSSSGNNYVYLSSSQYLTTAEFKTYLQQQYSAGTPVTVWYILSTPTTETITVPSGLSGTEEGYLVQDSTPTPTNPIYPTANTVEKWFDTNHYIMGTSTDTITTLPADIYANDTTATVGLKGDMVQSSQPSPTSPVMPQGCGNKTANLFTGQYSQFDNTGGTGTTYAYFKIDEDFTLSFKARNNLTVPQDYYVGISANGGNNSSGVTWTLGSNNTISAGDVRTVKSSTNDYHCFSFYPKNETVFNWLVENFEIMLNTGSTALPYEPFGVKIPISSANTTTPVYLGEVESTRKIKKYVFNGTEPWVLSSTIIYINNTDTEKLSPLICTHFPNVTNTGMWNGNNWVFQVDISRLGMSGRNAWITWLAAQYAAGTPVTVWYVLAEPETGIVNEPLMRIGDYADTLSNVSIPVIAGENTLDVQTTVQPSEVTANYQGWHPIQNVHEAENGQWD